MEIFYPYEIDERAEAELEMKGWIAGVRAVFDDGTSGIFEFVDPVRLSQDLADELKRTPEVLLERVVVVPAVTRATIEAALGRLSSRRR